MLGPANKSFDEVALFVNVLVVVAWFVAALAGRDDRLGVVRRFHQVDQPIRVIPFVRQQGVESQALDERRRVGDVGRLPRTQHEPHGVAEPVDRDVDLGADPSLATPELLGFLPPF